MRARQNLDLAVQLLALAGDRSLDDEFREAQIAEAQARAIVALAQYFALAVDLAQMLTDTDVFDVDRATGSDHA